MSAQHSPVSGQILKVIHDDSDEQVNDLRKHRLDQLITKQIFLLFSEMDYLNFAFLKFFLPPNMISVTSFAFTLKTFAS